MRSQVSKRILQKTPEWIKFFVSWYASIIVKLNRKDGKDGE